MANKSVTSCVPYLTFGYDEYLECDFCGLKSKVNHSLEMFEPQGKKLKSMFPILFAVQLEGTEFY